MTIITNNKGQCPST